MDHFKEISTVLPIEILLRIFSFLNLTDLVELSKINSFYMELAKIAYTEKVIKSKLIMEINLGTEQPISIRYECSKFNRKTKQTTWKPTAIIGSKNRRSVNTKEKVILRRIFFENEPKMMEKDNFNLVHEVKGEMDIKDSGVECIKGEEKLIELIKKNKKSKKDKKHHNSNIKNKKTTTKNNINNANPSKDSFELPKEEMIKTELSSRGSVNSRSSICSTESLPSIKDCEEGLMANNQCLFFYSDDTLIKETLKWSFEYKVESVSKDNGSWQKLQPSKLRLPLEIFYQNKKEQSNHKKHDYSKYKVIVKKNLINVLERFSNSFVGVV